MRRFVAAVFVLSLLSVAPAHADDRTKPIHIGTRVADIPDTPDDTKTKEAPRRRTSSGPDNNDPEQQTYSATRQSSFATPSIGVNAPGFLFNGAVPPDPAGEAGTTHYVHMVNTSGGARVGLFDKTNGARLKTFVLDHLAPPRSTCHRGLGDGIPLFDQFASRWLLTEIATSHNTECVYVSSGADPLTSTWDLYVFHMPTFPDYPKFSVWPNAYFMGYNNIARNDPVVAFDRTAMLAGLPAQVVIEAAPPLRGFGFQLLVPVDAEGATPPPVGAPGIFVRQKDDEITSHTPDHTKDFVEVWEFQPNFAVPASSTLTLASDVGVTSFDSRVCGLFTFACIPQAGTHVRLDPLREPVMNRPVFRMFGGHQSLVGTFVTDTNGHDHAGVRWFELRRGAADTTGNWTKFDDGTYAPDGADRWLPSTSINGAGQIALGYSASSRRSYPSIRVTDPLGTETLTAKSSGHQTIAPRWGDYSEMSVDPSDDTTFWYCNEILDQRGLWRTRIFSFTLS